MMHRHALLSLCLLLLPALFLAGCSDNAQPPGNQVTLTVLNTNTLQTYTPLWAACQDGVGGNWTSVTGSGTYTIDVTDPAGAYGFAVAVDTGMGIDVIYLQATLADGRALTVPVSIYPGEGDSRSPLDRITARRMARARIAPANSWDLSASISNIPPGFDTMSSADTFGSSSLSPVTVTSTNRDFEFPAGRPGDCCLLLHDLAEPYDTGVLYLQRNLTQPAGTTVDEDIDLSAPYDGSKHTYAVTGRSTFTATGARFVGALWMTANGTYLPLQSYGYGDSTDYPLIPDAVMTANDRYLFFGGFGDSYADYWSTAPVASITMPDAFTCGFADDTYTNLDHPGASLYQLFSGTTGITWIGMITQAWLTAAGATSATLPDFSTAAGWQPAWGFSEANPVAYAFADEEEFNFTLPDYLVQQAGVSFLRPTPPDGTFLNQVGYQAYPRY